MNCAKIHQCRVWRTKSFETYDEKLQKSSWQKRKALIKWQSTFEERYRSGHNEAVLKTVCPQGRVGSNPTLSVGQAKRLADDNIIFTDVQASGLCRSTQEAEGTPLERVQVVNSGARVQIPPSALHLEKRWKKLLTKQKQRDKILDVAVENSNNMNLENERLNSVWNPENSNKKESWLDIFEMRFQNKNKPNNSRTV